MKIIIGIALFSFLVLPNFVELAIRRYSQAGIDENCSDPLRPNVRYYESRSGHKFSILSATGSKYIWVGIKDNHIVGLILEGCLCPFLNEVGERFIFTMTYDIIIIAKDEKHPTRPYRFFQFFEPETDIREAVITKFKSVTNMPLIEISKGIH
ncbi:uncharacterized protein LOC117180552 [Belonocnema kinseyi]|uniref:uncharacterized protein LOC117180552 n=1 Tax=Belonocnema kinseyi TaxID=2817044 RepID=UPI00143D36D3|nr:uncharacterized protein LOC117180552 [Belonocnema kinseyi]